MTTTVTSIPSLTTVSKLRQFLNYPNGWRYGEGLQPSSETIDLALEINKSAAKGALKTNAFLGLDGDVSVTIYHGSDFLQFTVNNDHAIDFLREQNNEEIDHQDRLSLTESLQILDSYRLELWYSSVSSTAKNSTLTEAISETRPSKLQEEETVSHWLKKIARSRRAPRFANT